MSVHMAPASQQQLYGQYGYQEQGFEQGFDQGFDQLGSSPMGQHRTAPGHGQFPPAAYGSGSFGSFQASQDYVGDSFTDAGAFSRQEQHSMSSFLFDDDELVGPFMAPFSAGKDSVSAPSDGVAAPGGSPPSAVGTIGSPSRAPRSSANADGGAAAEGQAQAAGSGGQMPLYGGQYLSTHVY